jgi:hypothetical protein
MNMAPRLLGTLLFATAFSTAAPAAMLTYTANLTGSAEAPPNASPGTGSATVILDTDLKTMQVQASFSGLTGNVTAAHIHCCTAVPQTGTIGVATTTPTFTGFPSGVTAGSYDNTFDMTLASSYNASFVTANGGTTDGALAALQSGLDGGKAYFNIHTTAYTGGEIRGFLTAVPVPPAVWLAASGLAFLSTRLRRHPKAGSSR